MTTLVILLLLLFLYLAGRAAWFRLDPAGEQEWSETLHDSAYTLFALLAVVALPAALLLPLPVWALHWFVLVVAGVGLLAWGVFLAGYWEKSVCPVDTLFRPAPLPVPLVPLPSPVLPAPELASPDGEGEATPAPAASDVVKSYHWTYTPGQGTPLAAAIQLTINRERYEKVRAESRRPLGDWAYYAQLDMPELDALAATFHQLHHGRSWCTLEQASNVLYFTQKCITYRYDVETTPAAEWPRYPIETLMDEVGDCEDDVILTAAVLKRLGFEVALLYYPGHCALGVAGANGLPGEYVTDPRTGLNYFYGETTSTGWHLGEVPASYRGHAPDKIELVFRVISPQTTPTA